MKNAVTRAFVIPAIAFAAMAVNSQTCQVTITAESATAKTAARLSLSSAWAINQRTKKKYTSAGSGESLALGDLAPGSYKLYARKLGYKTTIRPIDLSCSDGPALFNLRMWEGNSREYVTDAVKEMRLDRITMIGNTDNGSRVVLPGEPYTIAKDCSQVRKTVSGGVLNGKVLSLPKPKYPPAAGAVRAGGAVSVQVLIDENGEVISASAVSGHPLLRASAESAAREAKFPPTLLSGCPVKVSGIITYNFVP